MLRLVVLAALLAVALTQPFSPFPQSDDTCSGVSICLQEGESDCGRAYRNHECAAGLYCKLNNVINTTTGEYTGTCTKAALKGEPCSNDPTDRIACYDPQYPSAVFCDDPLADGNGTCRFADVFYPGENCADDSDFINGGCVYGSCNNSVCTVLDAATRCDNGNRRAECPAGQYCDEANTNLCASRKTSGQVCEDTQQSYECDATLICTSRGGLYDSHTCLAPFVVEEGGTCDNILDCQAGLICDGSVCLRPAAYHTDSCENDGDCVFGWGCTCDIEVDHEKIINRGGKCTAKRVITSDQVNKYNKYQQCCKDNGCRGDLSYLFSYGDSSLLERDTAPTSCVWNCYKQAGYASNDVFSGVIQTGKCIAKTSSAAAVVPAVAVALAVIFALLF